MKGILIYLSFFWHKPFLRLKNPFLKYPFSQKPFKTLCCSHKPLESLGEISESTRVSYSQNFFYSVVQIEFYSNVFTFDLS